MANVLRAELKLENRKAVAASKRATGQLKNFGKEGTAATGKVAAATDKLKTAVVGMAAAYAGMAGIRMIMRALGDETERVDRVSRKATESMRAVLALSSLKGRRQEEIDLMKRMAVSAGRPLAEVSEAYYTLLGGTAGMAPARQAGLMQQALKFAKTDPRAGLDPIVNLYTTIASQQEGLAPRQISNLVSTLQEQAKATPEELATTFPGVAAVAKVGKVPISTAAAAYAFATRKGGGAAVAGTAVRAAMLGLIRPAKDVEAQLVALGFDPKASMLEKIQWLAQMGGQLPEQLQAALGGRRGIQAISAIASAPQEFAQERQLMQQALRAPGNLVQQKLAEMYGEVPAQMELDQIQQTEIMDMLEDVKPEKLREQKIMAFRRLLRKKTTTPLARKAEDWLADVIRDIKGAPMGELRYIEDMERLLNEGYSPAEVIGAFGKVGKGGTYEEYKAALGGARRMTDTQAPTTQPGPSGPNPTGPGISIGVQYNYSPGQAAAFPSKQEAALMATSGVA